MVTDQVSSIFWLFHSDLHEDRVTSVFEYMSSIVASLNPYNQYTNGHKGNWTSHSLLEQNSTRGKIFVRFKRRNGRVRVAVNYLSFLSLCLCVYIILAELRSRKLICVVFSVKNFMSSSLELT